MAIKFAAKDQEKGPATITAKAPDNRSNDREATAPNGLGEPQATVGTDLFNAVPKTPPRKRKSR